MQNLRHFSGESRNLRLPRSMREAYQDNRSLYVEESRAAVVLDVIKTAALIFGAAACLYKCTGVA